MSPTLAAQRARRILYVAVAVGIALLVMALGYAVAAILGLTQAVRDTQIEGTPTGKRLIESSDRILDCTDPEGECTKRNQEQTAEVVGDIQEGFVRVLAAGVGCSAQLTADPGTANLTPDQLEAKISLCITTRLASEKRTP